MGASGPVSAKQITGMKVNRRIYTGIWSSPMSNPASWAPPVLTIQPNPLAAVAELPDRGLGKRRMRVDSHIDRAMPQGVLPSSFGRAHATFAAPMATNAIPGVTVLFSGAVRPNDCGEHHSGIIGRCWFQLCFTAGQHAGERR